MSVLCVTETTTPEGCDEYGDGGIFRCEDGSCIPLSHECDQIRDCPYGEDEHDQCFSKVQL